MISDGLNIGRFNELKVQRITAAGAFLASAAGEILLPHKYLAVGVRAGDTVKVFVYPDSSGRLVATTVTPKAQVGEFALLQVADTGRIGAFLDWGLEKELLVPFSEQITPMKKGERYLVRVYQDNSGRIAASARLAKFLETGQAPLQAGEEVGLLVHELTPLGAKVIINGLYPGLLFKSELYGRVEPGDKLKGYVKKVRQDGKIDVTLRKGGEDGMDESRKRIIMALAATGGFLPLGDRSPPDEVAAVLSMSKKTFKRAIGSLYKDGIIDLTETGIRLRSS